MTNEELKSARSFLAQENRKYGLEPGEVPLNSLPPPHPAGLKHVYRSKHFMIQVVTEAVGRTRFTVCRTEIDSQGKYKDGITWDELQLLKSQCGYGNLWAVEIFPPDEEVVMVNTRHLWLLTDAPPGIGWRTKPLPEPSRIIRP